MAGGPYGPALQGRAGQAGPARSALGPTPPATLWRLQYRERSGGGANLRKEGTELSSMRSTRVGASGGCDTGEHGRVSGAAAVRLGRGASEERGCNLEPRTERLLGAADVGLLLDHPLGAEDLGLPLDHLLRAEDLGVALDHLLRAEDLGLPLNHTLRAEDLGLLLDQLLGADDAGLRAAGGSGRGCGLRQHFFPRSKPAL